MGDEFSMQCQLLAIISQAVGEGYEKGMCEEAEGASDSVKTSKNL